MPTRVHLADDHTMFRESLEAILASREGIEVVGSTSTGPEAAARVAKTRPDVIVTELDMQPRPPRRSSRGCARPPPNPGSLCSRCGTTRAT